MAPGHQGTTTRRAPRRGVKIGQTHAGGGKRIDVRRSMELTSVTPKIALAEVIGQDVNDVRLFRGRRHR